MEIELDALFDRARREPIEIIVRRGLVGGMIRLLDACNGDPKRAHSVATSFLSAAGELSPASVTVDRWPSSSALDKLLAALPQIQHEDQVRSFVSQKK